MTDGARPTSTDLMAVLEDVKKGMGDLRTDVSRLVQSRDAHAATIENHGVRIGELESQHRQHRELVTRLHDRIADVTREVAVVRNLLERSEEITRSTLRIAAQELSSQVTATVRAEMSGLRDDVRELRESVQARPCLVGECVITAEPALPTEPKE
jgi:septal ring factor EnvC (AmiA/AmiB activator)